MAVIRNLVVKIAADISSLSRGLKDAEKKLKAVSGTFSKIGGKLTMGLTMPLLALGGVVTKISGDFEQSMANAASVSGATAEELELMKEVARKMGSETVFSASEAADAMYYMASAGYKAEQMAASIQPILDLAAATQSDLAFTTDTVIATLNQFGLEADDAGRVTNVFASIIGSSQATLEKLSYSMRYVGPVAKSLGYSVEETAAALGLLYNSGFKGEQAGTVLRGALTRLLKPTGDMQNAMEELGLNSSDLDPSLNSLADIIAVLEKSGISTAQAVRIFGTEAGPGMMALISQGSGALLDMTNKITDTNSATEMANKQLDTMQGRAKILKSQMEELALQIGDVLIPTMSKLLEKYLSPLITKLSKASDKTKEAAIKAALFAVALGPVLLIIGKVIGVIATLTKIIPLLLGKLSPFNIILGLLAVVIAKLMVENKEFRETIKNLMKTIGELISSAGKPLLEILRTILPIVQKIIQILMPLVSGIIKVVAVVLEWLNETGLLEFALWSFIAVLALIVVTQIPSFIASLWSGILMIGKFVIAIGTTVIQALGKFIVTLGLNACLALGSFKKGITSVTVGLGAMAIGIGLAFAVFKNWDLMNGVQKVISVIGVLTTIVLGAALAFGLFHSAWSMGLAIAGIVAGIAAVTIAIAAAQKNIPSENQADVGAMSSRVSGGINGYSSGGVPDKSSLFYANEFGNPELVANFGGGTAVANNDMIVSAIENAAFRGMERVLSGNNNDSSERIAVFEINGREFARAVFDDVYMEGKRRGKAW